MSYHRDDIASWKVGGVRTLIGIAAGAAYLGLWLVIDQRVFSPGGYWPYLAGLLPVRIAEW
jgi:hypothetical protein